MFSFVRMVPVPRRIDPTADRENDPTMLRSDRNALVAFFALTFALSWGIWGTTLAFQAGLLDWKLPGDPLSYLAITVAAVSVTALFAERGGVKALLGRMIIWRVGVRWYLAALLLPGVPAVTAIAVHAALGGRHDVRALVPLSAVVPLLLTQILLHLLTEELGWRGFALPRLRTWFGPLASGLVLGVIWGAWHIPMFLVTGTRQTYPFAGFAILIVSISVIMTWIFDHTRGSVLIAALFHAAMNTWWAATNLLWGDDSLFWISVAATAVTAAAVALLQRREQVGTTAAPAVAAAPITR
jgi:membrane protease YdiL (CAAX protease family)